MDNNQTTYDFMFYVTPNQPVVFDTNGTTISTQDVPTFAGIGSLVCWAQGEDDRIPRGPGHDPFNHLYGTALIRNDATAWVYYNAFSFSPRGVNYFTAYDADNVVVPGPDYSNASWASLNLTGDAGYDTCPSYLVANFIPDGSTLVPGYPSAPTKPDLTLFPCKQDFRQDRIPTCTKAKFDIWNENEVKFTGAYQCFKCFFEGFLTDIGNLPYLKSRGPGYGGDKFSIGVLKTDVARMRIQGVYSSVCVASNVDAQPLTNPKTWVPSTRKGCPNIPVGATTWASRGAAFTAAWGSSSSAITPLLGVMLYGIPIASPEGLNVKAGYTLSGAGQAVGTNAGAFKYDMGAPVVEKPVR
jgi:hypothetical protein